MLEGYSRVLLWWDARPMPKGPSLGETELVTDILSHRVKVRAQREEAASEGAA